MSIKVNGRKVMAVVTLVKSEDERMGVPILVAIIAFSGTVVGGTIVTAGNYFLARMREQTEAARTAETRACELKMACRLIASELQQNYLTVEYYGLKEKRWWRPDQELSTEAWKQYKHLLAPRLPFDAWDDVANAVTNANHANVMHAALRPPNNPDDVFLPETVTALTYGGNAMRRLGLLLVMSVITVGAAPRQKLGVVDIGPWDAPQASQPPSPSGMETRQQIQTQPANSQDGPASDQKTTTPPSIIVHVDPPQKTEEEAEEDRRERKEKTELDRRLVDLTAELSSYTGRLYSATEVLAIATVFLVLATGGLLVMAFIQSRDVKASVAVAEQSADASLLALRPWVSCEANVIGDLTYRTDGNPCVTVQFILKNHGHSPAMGVRLLHWVNLLSPVHASSIHAQQRIAELLRGLPAQDYGLLLFPGNIHTSDVGLLINRTEIEKSIEDRKPKKHFFPELIVLISYTYPLASHNPETGLIYHLRKITPDKISGFAFDLDEVVPAGNMFLLDHGLWSKYAT